MSGGGKTTGQKMKDCRRFCWNSDTGEFLGRTGKSWGLIGLFYLIYYGSLAGFFAICMAVFFTTLDTTVPTQTNMYSLLKQNPGMGFRPMFDIDRTYIKFNANDSSSYTEYVEDLEKFLSTYTSGGGDDIVSCTGLAPGDRSDDKVCNFELSMLGDRCTAENKFGYPEGKPCVLLKINKVYGWTPVPYDNESLSSVKSFEDRFDPDYVGITCDGENDADLDNMKSVTYYPAKGFPSVYYPYLNQPNYMAPVVMVQFDVVPGRLLMVWCRAMAKNIKHHRMDMQGSIHFELLVDFNDH